MSIGIGLTNPTTTCYFDRIKLEQGSIATPFEYEDYVTTLAKCQRYYEPQDAFFRFDAAVSVAPITMGTRLDYKVEKRITPTITTIANASSNFDTLSYQDVSLLGCNVIMNMTVATAAEKFISIRAAADAEL